MVSHPCHRMMEDASHRVRQWLLWWQSPTLPWHVRRMLQQ